MRLIACPNCHAQYDVSGVIAPSVRCRCGSELENRTLTAVDAEIHRCGACGAQTEADADRCSYCASSLVRPPDLSLICPECYARNADASRFCTACGIGFRPEPLQVDGTELPCPACDLLMPPSQVGGLGLNECPSCHGLWVPGEHFDRLVARATEARKSADGSAQPRIEGGNPASRSVRYRKCPECQTFMLRRNYRRSSGVILDVCREHGTWLDADELEEIAGFILSGGRTSEALEAEHRAASAQAMALAATRIARTTTLRAERPDTLGGSLVRLITDILS